MTHSYGFRSGTRYKFAKGYRQKGAPNTTRVLTTFKRGEYVLIKVDGSVHKGMPHHYYHGRTGRVYDVTKNSVGVEIPKRVRWRIIMKRFHVRCEHLRKSNCQADFLKRIKENRELREEAKAKGIPFVPVKRMPEGPPEAKTVYGPIVDIAPVPFTENF